MVVFPVWRSPMINSHWSWLMGTVVSMALIPVIMDWLTEQRGKILGALREAQQHSELEVLKGPFPLMGFPSASTTHPSNSGPTGSINNLAGALDHVAFLDEPIVTGDGDTNIFGFQVKTHSTDTRRELYHLISCRRVSVGSVTFGWVTMEPTLHILKTPNQLKICSISSMFPPREEPEMQDLRIEETSEAATK